MWGAHPPPCYFQGLRIPTGAGMLDGGFFGESLVKRLVTAMLHRVLGHSVESESSLAPAIPLWALRR